MIMMIIILGGILLMLIMPIMSFWLSIKLFGIPHISAIEMQQAKEKEAKYGHKR